MMMMRISRAVVAVRARARTQEGYRTLGVRCAVFNSIVLLFGRCSAAAWRRASARCRVVLTPLGAGSISRALVLDQEGALPRYLMCISLGRRLVGAAARRASRR